MNKLFESHPASHAPFGGRCLKFLCCLVLGVWSFPAAFAALPPKLDDPVEGQQLARELRSVFPAEESVVRGTLRISKPGAETIEVPLESRVLPGANKWTSIYTARLPEGTTEMLTVHHFADKPSDYEWQRKGVTEKFAAAAATNVFAASDFALMDLGLEFFHWPTQILVTREMRKGRGSDVLESRPARPTLYSRVVSWIDQESRAQGQPGLIMAEAYDPEGKLLKEFEIRGMKKIDDRWQVREMELRNRQTKGRTRLEFQFEK